MEKLPAFQFYPGDWMKDPAVRSVSLAARGLWIDMLCLMHENDHRGYLQHATGKPVTAEQLARMTGCSNDETPKLLQELKDSGVFSCTKEGIIYNRRMVKDEYIRKVRSEAGKHGAPYGNLGGRPKGQKTANETANEGQNNPPSSSSSSSELPPIVPQGGRDDKKNPGNNKSKQWGKKLYTEPVSDYDQEKHQQEEQRRKQEHAEYRKQLETNNGELTAKFQEKIKELKDELRLNSWKTWIEPLLVVGMSNGSFVLFHENASWVQEHYAREIGDIVGKPVKVIDKNAVD